MPPEIAQSVVTILGTASVFVIGILTWMTGRRALEATRNRDAHARDDALITHYRGSWELEVEARRKERDDRERLEDKVNGLHDKVNQYRDEVDGLRAELERVKGWLDRLAAYIRDLLTWAAVVQHPTPHPRIPDDIAHLIQDKP